MKVLDFIRSNEHWETALTAAPYYIKIVHKDDYVLLKYNQLSSDFNNEIVRECRGCIMYIPNGCHHQADVVCYPFDKFGNYGESYTPEIDWGSAQVLEKVDGSLIKLWYHNGKWHISTNGTIDARDAETAVEGLTFYDIFIRTLLKNGNPNIFFGALDINYTYMFELVSPETRVTIEYSEPALYYLGARNMLHFNEVGDPWLPGGNGLGYFISFPKVYPLNSIEECLDAVNKMTRNEEGFVVRDKFFNRIKIKSPEYLIAARVRNNGVITVKRIIKMMREDRLDDFCAYAPQYENFVNKVVNAYKEYLNELQDMQDTIDLAKNKGIPVKVLAEYLQRERVRGDIQGFAFRYYNQKVMNPEEYANTLAFGKLLDIIRVKIK